MEVLWSVDEESFCYDSLGEIILQEDLEEGETVWFGESKPFDISNIVTGDDVLDLIIEGVYDNLGDPAGEDCLQSVTAESIKQLSDFISEWILRNDNRNYFHIDNVVEYTITQEDIVDVRED